MEDKIRIELVLSRRQTRGLLTLAVLFGCSYALHSESLTVTSYYPSPSGVFRKLIATAGAALARDGGMVNVGSEGHSADLAVEGSLRVRGGSTLLGSVRIAGGGPGAGKVLSSDDAGNATWKEPYAVYAPDN